MGLPHQVILPCVKLLSLIFPETWTYSCLAGANPVSGSGFLVNVPFTQKYCILTAGHNVRRPDEGRADRVEVFFPNGFTFTATAAELFVSKVYDAHPTLRDQDPSSISDYALIAVDRVKHPMTEGQAMGGCSLSVLPSRSELLHTGGTVYGYSLGNVLQTKETSPFSRPVQAQFLEYEKDTHEGVSGGPIFVSYNAGDVAIGIQ
jgi:V8-like Glu-specific endopeptidase